MVYKNLFLRIVFSLLIFGLFIVSLQNNKLILLFGLVIYVVIILEVIKFFKIYYYLILIYVILSILSFIIYINYFYNFYLFNILIFSLISLDSFSFFFGKLFGKKNIFKKISPNKTLEGYLGGFLMTNLIFLIYCYLNEYIFFENIVLINLFILSGIIGDLIQSYFKRVNKIKDSSNYLPGHGGFFDRFDSFMSSIILLTIISL